MADNRYNGWRNYETWNVKLWIDNDEGSYHYWQDRAQEIFDDADECDDTFSKSDSARLALADALKDEIDEQGAPDLGACMYADLLNAALSEVDWMEIADALLEDCDGYETWKHSERE